MKKRMLSLTLAALLILSFAGCGKGPAPNGSSPTAPNNEGEGSTAQNIEKQDAEIAAIRDEFGIIPQSEVTVDASRKSTANSNEKLASLRLAWNRTPTELGIERYDNTGNFQIVNIIYETLLEKDGINEYGGRLAEEFYWEDSLHYIVKLYEYIYDSDGNHVTASDVIFSYNYKLNAKQLSSSDFLESIDQVDEYTVRFTFSKELDLSAFDNILTQAYIVSEKAFSDHEMVTDPIGTGPYYLSDYVSGAYAVLEARDDYWQKDELVRPLAKANVQTFQIDFISDSAMNILALQNGTNDYYHQISETDLPAFVGDGKYADQFRVYSYANTNTYTIEPNCSSASICSDINMRLAIFYALDTQGFIDALGSTSYSPCTVDTARSTPDYQASWDTWESYMTTCDLSLVKEYLNQAGYKGETVKIICEENDAINSISVVLNGMLTAAGIKSEIAVYTKALLHSYLADEKAWDLFIASGSADYTITRLYEAYSVSCGIVDGFPVNFAEDEAFQTMLSEYNTTANYSIEHTEEVLQYIIDHAYSYAICSQNTLSVYRNNFASIAEKWGTYRIIPTACDFYLD